MFLCQYLFCLCILALFCTNTCGCVFGCTYEYILFDVCVWEGVVAWACICVCICFPCGSKSPHWHVGSVGKQQVWDTLMAFTDGFRTLCTGGLLLHLLIYSFSTAEETLRPMWCFREPKSLESSLGVFLSSLFSPLILSPPLSPCPLFYRSVCVFVCVFVCVLWIQSYHPSATGWPTGFECHCHTIIVSLSQCGAQSSTKREESLQLDSYYSIYTRVFNFKKVEEALERGCNSVAQRLSNQIALDIWAVTLLQKSSSNKFVRNDHPPV